MQGLDGALHSMSLHLQPHANNTGHDTLLAYCCSQGITAEGIQSVADALYLHTSITELILAHNSLGDEGTLAGLGQGMVANELLYHTMQYHLTYAASVGACEPESAWFVSHMQHHALSTCQRDA